MPAYVPAGNTFRPWSNTHELRERERMARLTFVLRHGTAEQRRRALRMKLLPLPEDPAAVAVAGVAVLDLPRDAHSSAAPRSAFDPLAHVAARYGGVPQDADNGDGDSARGAPVDFSAFMEVLCPDGTSLLESLPLTPCGARRADVPPSQPASPRSGVHTRAPSSAIALPNFPLDAEGPRPEMTCRSDEPLSVNSELAPPRAAATENAFEMPTRAVERQPAMTGEVGNDIGNVEASAPQVFASGGSSSHAKPCRRSRSSVSQLSTCRSVSGLSRSAKGDAATRCTRGAGGINSARSLGASVPSSPAEVFSRESTQATTLPQDAHIAGSNWELCDRVLLTDRLVRAHTGTALPSMISAFNQYVRATTRNSDDASQPSLRLSKWQVVAAAFQLGGGVPSEEAELSVQRLAPRQRGIPLKCYGTNNEVLLCVQQAEQCVRPTFRRVDPAELYGSSHYLPCLAAHAQSC